MAISPAVRILGAFVVLLIFLQALHVTRNPIHRLPQAPEVAAADHTSLTSLDSGDHNSNLPALGFSITSIPDKVWHKANQYNITDQQREWVSTWVKTNPSCRQELFSDGSSQAFVRSHYGHTRPDIVEVYEALSIPILRADLFRYLLLLEEGGYWSDLDVTCEKSLSEWIPAEYNNGSVDMIVGLEFDMDWQGPNTEVASQFCNWVFAAQPSSRNLRVIIDAVITKIKKIATDQGIQISEITLDVLTEDVVNVTGPKMMTISIMESLKKLLGREVDDRDFAHIKRPTLVGDVLIMPGVSFAALQNGNPADQGDALVSHHYEGTWKKDAEAAKERKKQKELERNREQGGGIEHKVDAS